MADITPPNARKRKTLGARIRFDVLQRCNFACYYCGVPAALGVVELHIDHVLPVSLGGSNEPWNLVAACSLCNLGKADSVPSREVVQRVRQEWLDYDNPRAGSVILCRYCGIPVALPEGEEGAIQCDPCMDARIDAWTMGVNA